MAQPRCNSAWACRRSAFRYLNSHGALDQDHMKFFEALMNRIEDPADQAAIIEMAKDMFGLFGGMFAAIELEGVARCGLMARTSF